MRKSAEKAGTDVQEAFSARESVRWLPSLSTLKAPNARRISFQRAFLSEIFLFCGLGYSRQVIWNQSMGHPLPVY